MSAFHSYGPDAIQTRNKRTTDADNPVSLSLGVRTLQARPGLSDAGQWAVIITLMRSYPVARATCTHTHAHSAVPAHAQRRLQRRRHVAFVQA